MSDPLLTDLRVVFRDDGAIDLAVGAAGLETVSGAENLGQALTLRLLVRRGELEPLGHRRYGSRIHELLGEPMDPANLERLRRLVRKALEEDPRVASIKRVTVTPRRDQPGTVAVEAAVVPVLGGDEVRVEVELDVE